MDTDAYRSRWDSRTKIVISLLLLALGVYLLYRFSGILPPLVLAVVIAYVLSPLVEAFQRRLSVNRAIAVLLAYLVLILILVSIPMVIIPPLAAQLTELNLDLQRLILAVEEFLGRQLIIGGWVIDWDVLFQQSADTLSGSLEPFFGQTLSLVVEVISSLVWVIFITIVSFYLVKDWHSIRSWVEQITPPDYREDLNRLSNHINHIWSSFFRGQLILASVVAFIFTIIGFLLGLPFALAMGVLAGLLEFLPSIGHGIWLVSAATLALFIGSTWLPLPNWVFALLIIGLHIVYQQFDLNYLIPRIIGRSVHLPPLVVILGIVAGAVLAGVLGILLAAPTIASARVIGRYIYANLFDMDPFAVTVAPQLPPPNPRWWRTNPYTSTSSDLNPGKDQ